MLWALLCFGRVHVPPFRGTFRAGTPRWYPPWYISLRYLCRPSSISGRTCRECRPGFFIRSSSQPPRVLLTAVNSASEASVLQQGVSSILLKGAIEEFSSSDLHHGFFSRYFLVQKKDGGLRPILDLRRLNYSLYRGKFRMLTLKSILSQVQEGDWFVTIDLNVQRHRKFLRFAFRGKAYQYKVLPFGLALAPWTLTKCMDAEAPGHPNPQLPGRLAYFSQLQGFITGTLSFSTFARLASGWMVRRACSLQPSIFWGVCLDSTSMQTRLAPARVESIQSCATRFKLGRHMSVGLCRRLLGLMVAASPVLPLGLLHMRPFFWWMKSLGIRPSWPSLRLLKVSGNCFRAL